MPGSPHRLIDKPIRFVILDELKRCRVKLERPPELNGDLGKIDQRARTKPILLVESKLPPGLDCLDKVRQLRLGLRKRPQLLLNVDRKSTRLNSSHEWRSRM